MLSLWSLCSRSLMYSSSVEESAWLKEDHMKDINSFVVRLPIFVLDSKIVAETDVLAESVEDMLPSFKCFVLCNGPWGDREHWTYTHSQGMAFKKYIYEIKRARGDESMTSWINRSDEALMDTRKNLATLLGANSSESTMIPPQIQGWLLLHKARLRDQEIVGVMNMTGGSLNIKLVEKSLPDLFTDDVLQSVDRSRGKDSGNHRKQHAFEEVEEVPEDDDDTYLDEDLSENDDPHIDEDGNFLANEQIVSAIDVMKNATKHSLVIVRDGPSSSQVCFKCGSNDHWASDCPKMDVGPSNLKMRDLGAYAYGAWTSSNPDNSRDEKVFFKLVSSGFLVWYCGFSCPRRR